MTENELSKIIIGAAIRVHSALGPGLLENAYLECLYYLLVKEGLYVEKQKPMPVLFEEVKVECGYRVDLLVENKVIVEGKSIEALHPIHMAQTLTYLRLGGIRLGLLINFNVLLLKNGIKRVANGMIDL
jgi:GxxExxY protein